MENPPPKFFRLAPGREVRLRNAYLITCQRVVKDHSGDVVDVHCTYDPATRGGDAPDGRKVKATLHWVSAEHSTIAEVRLYDRLFSVENPGTGDTDFLDAVEPDVARSHRPTRARAVARTAPHRVRAFSSSGWATSASIRTPSAGRLVFNRTVTLKDAWARIQSQGDQRPR